jgi:hypothetical protein
VSAHKVNSTYRYLTGQGSLIMEDFFFGSAQNSESMYCIMTPSVSIKRQNLKANWTEAVAENTETAKRNAMDNGDISATVTVKWYTFHVYILYNGQMPVRLTLFLQKGASRKQW